MLADSRSSQKDASNAVFGQVEVARAMLVYHGLAKPRTLIDVMLTKPGSI